jgi:hypothetical protein
MNALEQEHSLICGYSRKGKAFKELHRKICDADALAPTEIDEIVRAYAVHDIHLPEADKRVAELCAYACPSPVAPLSLNKLSLSRIVDNSNRVDIEWLTIQHKVYDERIPYEERRKLVGLR